MSCNVTFNAVIAVDYTLSSNDLAEIESVYRDSGTTIEKYTLRTGSRSKNEDAIKALIKKRRNYFGNSAGSSVMLLMCLKSKLMSSPDYEEDWQKLITGFRSELSNIHVLNVNSRDDAMIRIKSKLSIVCSMQGFATYGIPKVGVYGTTMHSQIYRETSAILSSRWRGKKYVIGSSARHLLAYAEIGFIPTLFEKETHDDWYQSLPKNVEQNALPAPKNSKEFDATQKLALLIPMYLRIALSRNCNKIYIAGSWLSKSISEAMIPKIKARYGIDIIGVNLKGGNPDDNIIFDAEKGPYDRRGIIQNMKDSILIDDVWNTKPRMTEEKLKSLEKWEGSVILKFKETWIPDGVIEDAFYFTIPGGGNELRALNMEGQKLKYVPTKNRSHFISEMKKLSDLTDKLKMRSFSLKMAEFLNKGEFNLRSLNEDYAVYDATFSLGDKSPSQIKAFADKARKHSALFMTTYPMEATSSTDKYSDLVKPPEKLVTTTMYDLSLTQMLKITPAAFNPIVLHDPQNVLRHMAFIISEMSLLKDVEKSSHILSKLISIEEKYRRKTSTQRDKRLAIAASSWPFVTANEGDLVFKNDLQLHGYSFAKNERQDISGHFVQLYQVLTQYKISSGLLLWMDYAFKHRYVESDVLIDPMLPQDEGVPFHTKKSLVLAIQYCLDFENMSNEEADIYLEKLQQL